MKIQTQKIKCPECNYTQDAIVKHTPMFPIFIHECEKCKYVIMESEWDVIN